MCRRCLVPGVQRTREKCEELGKPRIWSSLEDDGGVSEELGGGKRGGGEEKMERTANI